MELHGRRVTKDDTVHRIGRYDIVRKLGEGATSKVYLADDPFEGRQVAIKLLFPEILEDTERGNIYRKMFVNEASLAGELVHPHIAQIFDAVVEEGFSYIVMEYVDGGALEQFCRPDNLLEPREAAEVIFKCARALAFAHKKGLIHRDIKPGNILCAAKTDVKLADFGLAINEASDRTVVAGLGSPAYMAPELLTGAAQPSIATDIYALGVVMYQLLAGRLPFEAENTASMIYQIVYTAADPPSKHRPGVSADVDAIVMRAMAQDASRRYQTWNEFGQDLVQTWKEEKLQVQEGREAPETVRFSALRGLSFFKDFPEEELWEVLRISKWAMFPAGTALIKEGDIGDSCFVIVTGFAEVTRGKRKLAVLSAGECFGEMPYVSRAESPRSATVTTTTECVVMKVPAESLRAASAYCRALFDQQFIRVLVDRLNKANEQLELVA